MPVARTRRARVPPAPRAVCRRRCTWRGRCCATARSAVRERLSVVRAVLALGRVRPGRPGGRRRLVRRLAARARAGPRAPWRRCGTWSGVATLNARADEASLALAATVFQVGLLRGRAAGDLGWSRVPLAELHADPAAAALRAAGRRCAAVPGCRHWPPRGTGRATGGAWCCATVRAWWARGGRSAAAGARWCGGGASVGAARGDAAGGAASGCGSTRSCWPCRRRRRHGCCRRAARTACPRAGRSGWARPRSSTCTWSTTGWSSTGRSPRASARRCSGSSTAPGRAGLAERPVPGGVPVRRGGPGRPAGRGPAGARRAGRGRLLPAARDAVLRTSS